MIKYEENHGYKWTPLYYDGNIRVKYLNPFDGKFHIGYAHNNYILDQNIYFIDDIIYFADCNNIDREDAIVELGEHL